MGNQCKKCIKSLYESRSEDSLDKDSESISVQLKQTQKKPISKSLKLQKKEQKLRNIKNEGKKFNIESNLLHKRQENLRKEPFLQNKLYDKDIKSIYEFERFKDRIKPKINKLSTQDEQRAQYYANQYFDSDSDDQEQTTRTKRVNMTYTSTYDSIVIAQEFRTLNKNKVIDINQTIEEIENVQSQEQKVKLQIQTAKYFFQMKKYEECEQHLEKGLSYLKGNDKESRLKIQILKLFGCKRLLENKIGESIEFLKEVQKLSDKEQNICNVDLNYWLGECFLRQEKTKVAKIYLNKAMAEYFSKKLDDDELLVMFYLQLGNLYFKQEQFAEADKFYSKGIKVSENTGKSPRYLELILKKACNYVEMDSYKKSMIEYAKLFKNVRQNNLTNLPIYTQSQKSYTLALNKISEAVITENELLYIIKISEELMISNDGMINLKTRLKKMREILYKQ